MIRTLVVCLLAAPLAVGQEGLGRTVSEVVPVNSFTMESGNIETMTMILNDQFPGITFSGDIETASIYARIDGEDAERVQRLINEISMKAVQAREARRAAFDAENRELEIRRREEQRVREQDAVKLQTVRLQHIQAEEALLVLSSLGFEGSLNIAVLGPNLVMRGVAGSLEEAAELLEQIDLPSGPDEIARARNVETLERQAEPDSFHKRQQMEERQESDLRRLHEELELRSRELSERIRQNRDPDQNGRLVDELSKVIAEQFQRKIEAERREMEQIRRRLDQVAQRLEMQERLAERIIGQRVQQLIGSPDEAKADLEQEQVDRRARMLHEQEVEADLGEQPRQLRPDEVDDQDEVEIRELEDDFDPTKTSSQGEVFNS